MATSTATACCECTVTLLQGRCFDGLSETRSEHARDSKDRYLNRTCATVQDRFLPLECCLFGGIVNIEGLIPNESI